MNPETEKNMVIYPNAVKRQGNIVLGIVEIIGAMVFAGIIVAVTFYIQQKGFQYFFIPVIIAALVLITGLISGIIDLVRGLRGRRTMRDGYKTSCVIVSTGYYHSHSARKGPYIIVEYVSQTNQKHLLRVSPGLGDYTRLRIGTTIECYVLGENCYINTKEGIKVISEPEKEMTIKEAFTSLFKDTK